MFFLSGEDIGPHPDIDASDIGFSQGAGDASDRLRIQKAQAQGPGSAIHTHKQPVALDLTEADRPDRVETLFHFRCDTLCEQGVEALVLFCLSKQFSGLGYPVRDHRVNAFPRRAVGISSIRMHCVGGFRYRACRIESLDCIGPSIFARSKPIDCRRERDIGANSRLRGESVGIDDRAHPGAQSAALQSSPSDLRKQPPFDHRPRRIDLDRSMTAGSGNALFERLFGISIERCRDWWPREKKKIMHHEAGHRIADRCDRQCRHRRRRIPSARSRRFQGRFVWRI